MATEDWSSASNNGTAIAFTTTSNGSNILTERMRIDQSGNVGIGWSTPAAKLSIAGAIHMSARVGTEDALSGAVLPIQGAYIGWNEDNGQGMTNFMNHRGIGLGGFNFSLFDGSGNFLSTPLVINQVGNVGIGTVSPAERLDLGNGALVFTTPQTPSIDVTYPKAYYANDTGNGKSGLVLRAWTLGIKTGNLNDTTTKVTIDNLGNVGIGMADPTSKLEVVGNITAHTDIGGQAFRAI